MNYDTMIDKKYHPENFIKENEERMRECVCCGELYDIDSATYKTDSKGLQESGEYICPDCWDAEGDA